MALKIIPINLKHCEAAQDLLIQTVGEEKMEVVIVADQYRNLDVLSWKTTFVRVKISDIYFYSCYMPPACLMKTSRGY